MGFIKKKYGLEGYAAWYQLIEQLADAEFHYLDLREETELMLLSGQLMIPETMLMNVITDLAKLNAFNKTLWENHKVIFSQKLVDEIQDAYSRRRNKCIDLEGLCNKLGIKCDQKPGKCTPNDGNNPQSKVKKSKVKNTKQGSLASANGGVPFLELIPLTLQTPEFIAAWKDWNQFRKESRKSITGTTAQRQMKTLGGHPVETAIAMIEQSITNSWTGLFPLSLKNQIQQEGDENAARVRELQKKFGGNG